MRVNIEFFGIPRQRTGQAATSLDFTAAATTLEEVLVQLAEIYPAFGESCVADQKLREGFVANLDGERFVTASETELVDGQTVLILSADAGG